MKRLDQDLDRLLRTAAGATARPLVELDLGLQNRVLAQIRSSPVVASITALSALCWRGALAACTLAAVAVTLAFLQSPVDATDPYSEAESLSIEAAGFALN